RPRPHRHRAGRPAPDATVGRRAALPRPPDQRAHGHVAPHVPPLHQAHHLTAPLSDRAALAAAFEAAGLDEDAQRLAGAAAWALQLVPAAVEARSRLGGPALLPRGESWPRDGRGRPLTFLAAIDLA